MRRPFAACLVALCWLLLASCSEEGVSLQVPPALSTLPGDCAGCHPSQVEEWRASRHADAFRDALFQHEFNPQRWAWCVGCHAPLVASPETVRNDDPLATQGIGCLACHLREGDLVSRTRAVHSPHQTRVWAAFGSPSFCGECHQFNFPELDERGRLLRYTEHPMQATLAQYQSSELPGAVDCLDCHMRNTQGHSFPGARQGEMLSRALSLSLCRSGDALVVEVRNEGAGHHIPSGGIDRHLWLRVWRSSAPEGLWEGFLGRRFRQAEGPGKETVFDNSIPRGEGRAFSVPLRSLAGNEGEVVNAALWYSYVPPKMLALFPEGLRRVLGARALPASLPLCSGAIQAAPLLPAREARAVHGLR
jgi:hypothetical protein